MLKDICILLKTQSKMEVIHYDINNNIWTHIYYNWVYLKRE